MDLRRMFRMMKGDDRSSRESGQIIPVMAIIFLFFVVAGIMLINITALKSSATVTADGALRSSALAALEMRRYVVPSDLGPGVPHDVADPAESGAPPDSGSRWIVSDAADAQARDYLALNLFSVMGGCTEPQMNGGGTYSATIADPVGVVCRGTVGDTQSGLDVEIINPAQREGQTSFSYLNDSLTTTQIIDTSYPQTVRSQLTGADISTTAIVLRLRINVKQMDGSASSITRTTVVLGGTDE
jgi:hypothetical protein